MERVLDPKGDMQAATRAIYCTPTFGAYGNVAYWVLVLNGSPPRGAIIIPCGWNARIEYDGVLQPQPIVIEPGGRPKRTKTSRMAVDTLNALLDQLEEKMPYPHLKAACAFEVSFAGDVVIYEDKST